MNNKHIKSIGMHNATNYIYYNYNITAKECEL